MIRLDVPSNVQNRGSLTLETTVPLQKIGGTVVPFADFKKSIFMMLSQIEISAGENLPSGQTLSNVMVSVPEMENITQITFYSVKSQEELEQEEAQRLAEIAYAEEMAKTIREENARMAALRGSAPVELTPEEVMQAEFEQAMKDAGCE